MTTLEPQERYERLRESVAAITVAHVDEAQGGVLSQENEELVEFAKKYCTVLEITADEALYLTMLAYTILRFGCPLFVPPVPESFNGLRLGPPSIFN